MEKPKKRGLLSLLEGIEEVKPEVKTEDKIYSVPLYKIEPNPDQPRKTFHQDSLEELAQSIRENGIIQPIVVRRNGSERYSIIAGERRYRAAKIAGLDEVPIIIKNYDAIKTKEISLIENLQREDLNPMEQCDAINELMTFFNMTQEEVANRIGKSRSAVANVLRLAKLCEGVKTMIREGLLSEGHGRALVSVAEDGVQLVFAQRAVDEQWSVRETEYNVRDYLSAAEEEPISAPEDEQAEGQEEDAPPSEPQVKGKTVWGTEMKTFLKDMSGVFSTKVRLVGTENKGRLAIEYKSPEELQTIYRLLATLKK